MMSSNFGLIPPLTAELAAPECLKKSMLNLVATLAHPFLIGMFFILAGKEDSLEISDKFQFRSD